MAKSSTDHTINAVKLRFDEVEKGLGEAIELLRAAAAKPGYLGPERSFDALIFRIIVREGPRLARGRSLSLHPGEPRGLRRRHSGELREGREVAWVRHLAGDYLSGVDARHVDGANNIFRL